MSSLHNPDRRHVGPSTWLNQHFIYTTQKFVKAKERVSVVKQSILSVKSSGSEPHSSTCMLGLIEHMVSPHVTYDCTWCAMSCLMWLVNLVPLSIVVSLNSNRSARKSIPTSSAYPRSGLSWSIYQAQLTRHKCAN